MRKPTEPISETMSSRSSSCLDSMISLKRFSIFARSRTDIHGQGPSSNARRAASIAMTACLAPPSRTRPTTSSVAGSITSISAPALSLVHRPSMKFSYWRIATLFLSCRGRARLSS